jgi:RHS repeat-associated protein
MFDTRVSSVNDTWDWNRGRLIWYYSSNHVWGASGTDNNGNVMFAENWVPPPNATLDQAQFLIQDSYSYDSLNRLSAVNESSLNIAGGGSWTPQFAQSYIYDRYGNRTINTNPTATYGGVNNKAFSIDTTNNRLTVPSGQTGTMSYDNAGNLTTDTYSAAAVTRVYDAENRMTSETQANSYAAGTYSYDGDGRRVKRVVGSVETWQIYGLGGELVAEYAANGPPPSPQKEYGYRNGQLLVTAEAATASAPPPSGLAASPSSGNVALSWSAASGAIKYRIERKGAGGAYTSIGTTTSITFTDNVGSGSAYLYKVCAADGSGNCTSGYSNVVLGAAVPFITDPTIITFVENPSLATSVKAAHITELRSAVNAVRSLAGLPAASWTNLTLTPGFTVIRADDVRDLRLKLDEALTALGVQTSAYTDTTLATGQNGTLVRRIHITELRLRATSGIGGSGGSASTSVQIHWLVADQLGTPRMIFDQSGSLANVSRHDYLPFGEELFAGTGGRLTTMGYTNADGARQKFTQYERDNETGLDYAHARYYGSSLGRFTSPDPMTASAQGGIPQSWNRYSYCINSPLVLTDPSGLIWGSRRDDKTGITTYEWFQGDKVGVGFNKVTNFYVEGEINGRRVGLTLNPNGPNSFLVTAFRSVSLAAFFSVQSGDYYVKGYSIGPTQAQFHDFSMRGSVDMMPNQAFDVGLTFAGVRGLGSLETASAKAGLSMEGKAYEFGLVNKHLLGTAAAEREIAGGSAHVFNDLSTLSRAESEIFSRGTYTGSQGGFTRFGFRFGEPIGTRIGKDGTTTALDYGEMKLRANGLYHIIPRTGPRQ